MYTNDELNEIIRNLGKSTVSENYRDSLVSNNLTPRVSYRVSSDQEIPRESSEFKRPFELYTKTNSIFSKNKDKSHFLALNNVASPRKTLFKRKGSAEIMNSQENPMDLIENQISPLELEFRKLEKGSKSPLNLKFDLKPIQIKDTFEILKGFLLLAIEVERLEAETKTWKYLYNELEGRLQLLVKEKEEIRENFDNSLLKQTEVKKIALQFMEERQAWESDLKKMKEKIEIKTRDLDISKQNNEKLQRALFSLENKTGKGQENKLLEEIDQWKQRNSLLEIKLQEMKPIEKRLLEYEGKIGTLLQENTNLKGRLLKITQDLDALTTKSDKNLEENDSLKQKCNKLEILLTEIRLNEAKLKKELSNIKQNTKN